MAIVNIFNAKEGKLKIGNLKVDISLSESHERTNTITTNPVEEGADISDHITVQPDKLTISALISATPVKYLAGSSSETRIDDAWGELEEMRKNKEILDVETGLMLYENMGIESLTATRDPKTGKALKFDATFQKVNVVTSQTVVVAAKPVPEAKKISSGSKNLGKQTPGPSDAAGKAASVIAQITGLGA